MSPLSGIRILRAVELHWPGLFVPYCTVALYVTRACAPSLASRRRRAVSHQRRLPRLPPRAPPPAVPPAQRHPPSTAPSSPPGRHRPPTVKVSWRQEGGGFCWPPFLFPSPETEWEVSWIDAGGGGEQQDQAGELKRHAAVHHGRGECRYVGRWPHQLHF